MRGLGLILYGTEGMGKTSWGLEWSRLGPVTFCSVRETGFLDLTEFSGVPKGVEHFQIKNYEQLIKITKGCEEKTTLVVDALSGVQQELFDHTCLKNYQGDWEKFSSYWKGQRVDSPKHLETWLVELDNARNRKVNVVLLGHAKLEESVNTIGTNFLCRTIDLDKEVLASLRKWAQAIIFMHLDISISVATEINKEKVMVSGKAKDQDNRVMYVTQSPGHSAKNRDLFRADKPVIRMGNSSEEAFLNFYNALPEVYRKSWPLRANTAS